MSHIEPNVVPDEYYSSKDVDRLFAALEMRLHAKEILHTKEAAKLLDISTSKLYRMNNLPSHRVPGINGKLYLRSELIDFIKRH